MTDPSTQDTARRLEMENLLRAAHVHRRRGDYTQAQQVVARALELSPDDAEARELAADLTLARGELEQAAAAYKALFDEDKTRVQVEEKYARVIVQIAEGRRQQEMLREMLENPRKFNTPQRSPLVAAILSLFPGLGHVYCNQYVKGIALMLVAGLAWLLFVNIMPSMPDHSGLSERIDPYGSSGGRINYFIQNLSPAAILILCVAVFTGIYAIVDAAVVAEKTRLIKDSEPR